MTTHNYNLLIYQQSRGLPEDLPEFMLAKGCGSQVVTDIHRLLDAVVQLRAPILLIEAGPTERSQMETAQFLIRERELHKYPLIFLAEDPEAVEGPLQDSFTPCFFLPAVVTARDVNAIVARLAPHYRPGPERVSFEEIPAGPTYTVERLEREETKVTEVAEDLREFPEYFFDQLHRLDIIDSPIGGGDLLKSLSLESMQEEGLLPDSLETKDSVFELFSSLRSSGREHLARTNYTTESLRKAMQLPKQYENVSKASSLLFAWAMTGAAAGLLQQRYFPGEGEAAENVASKVRLSAEKIELNLKDEEMARIVLQMAALIGEGRAPESDTDFAMVSALVAADIANRMCFLSGKWNPRGVHSLMRKIKAGHMKSLHPVALSCLVKFLNEAVAQVQGKGSVDPEEEPVVREDGAKQQRIPILHLKPGMRLAQPLYATDGRLIAESDLKLDPDLIWRIWQLAAIRILKSPYVVFLKD